VAPEIAEPDAPSKTSSRRPARSSR
jgi:hypothetical protein